MESSYDNASAQAREESGMSGIQLPSRQEAEDLLYKEAALLDEWRLDEWLELLTEDATYEIPPTDVPEGDSQKYAVHYRGRCVADSIAREAVARQGGVGRKSTFTHPENDIQCARR